MATGRVPTTANSPLTAKGDLFTYSTAPARLAVSDDGSTLVADSAASTGLRYTSGIGLTQPVINGAFDVWQRGTSINTSGSSVKNYTADQWNLYRGALVGGATVSRQDVNDTTNLPSIQYCARVSRTAGNTGTERIGFEFSAETANSIPLVGKTVTLSFYARKGADFSAASSILPFSLVQGTGTDQSCANTGFTGQSNAISGNATLTTTWQRFSATGTIATTSKEIGISFLHNPSGTAGAADYYEVTGVQIDVGNVALPFRRAGGTIQGELAACQRYYYKMTSVSGVDPFGTGPANSTTTVQIITALPVTMRTAPTAAYTGTFRVGGGGTVTGITAANLALNQAFAQQVMTQVTTTGLTTGWAMFLLANGDASIAFSSEL
jgi:hypothetical protein